MAIEPKITGIYKIVNTINGHKYVGSAVDMKKRWKRHLYELEASKHHSPKLQNAWNKYGEDAFEFSVIEECERARKVLLGREQYWMDTLESYGPSGYNIAKHAANPMLGRAHTTETREKMSDAQKGKIISEETRAKLSAAATNSSPETRKKISDARKGKKASAQTRAKMSVSAKNKPPVSEETKTKISVSSKNRPPISEETRKKISDARKGKKASVQARAKMAASSTNPSPETRKKMSDAHRGVPISKETIAVRTESRAIKRAERLALLPIVLAKILFLLYGMPVDNTPKTC